MESSPTSSSRKSFKYDAFLSFIGEDTSETFVNHLYAAFQRQGIHTYKNDERIEEGREIDDEVLRSIQDSKFSIIVISEDYASSSRCLDELVKIMECHDTTEHTAYPVFYDVESVEVLKQIGAVGKAFAEHNKKEAAGKWRQALEDAATLSGWDLRSGHEAQVIDQIVKKVSLDLRPIRLSNDENLIGMEPRMQDLEAYLGIGLNNDVRMIGIKGMGGIGKTTLAKAIFDKVSSQFEGMSFVENVREVSKVSGLLSLQNQVLSDVLKDEHEPLGSSVHDGKDMIKMRLVGKKALIVLDDVDHEDQLEALAGAANWFKGGSRIIITTRDEQVLVAHGVSMTHDVRFLSDEEAIRLFSRYAFERYVPLQGFEKLSLKVVHYAAGLPLTLKVLGSFLRGKEKVVWLDALRRLETIPLKQTLDKLEISYIGLEKDHKEIFLDVACFMKGLRKDDAIRILESCGFRARDGLRILQQKSLLTISKQRLGMHNSIEELGRNIVRRLHPREPHKHSRLWIRDEIEDLLYDDMGTEETTCIRVHQVDLSPETVMEGLGNLKKLRVLLVSETDDDCFPSYWKFDRSKKYFPNALQFLFWESYPLSSLPQSFLANNLVGLELPSSKIIQLWESGERKVLKKLRFLDLSYSKLRTLDLSTTPNLERLDLRECHDLVELHVTGGCPGRLVYLNLIGCSSFKSFLFIKRLVLLQLLSLPKLEVIVESLEEFPRYSHDNLPKLRFTCFYLEEEASSIKTGEKSISLNLQPCKKLKSVSGSICDLQHLRHLTFNGFIPEVPKDLDRLAYLERLDLLSTSIKRLPDSICKLKHLKSLKLKSCLLLEELPRDLGWVECLEKLSLSSTSIECLPDSICMLKRLKSLKVKSCLLLEEVPVDLGQLECLEKLDFFSARIKHLPDSICMLKHLKNLKLESCWLLEKLPKDLGRLECLEKLILTKCSSLRDIPNSICKMKRLRYFHLPFCTQVQKLPEELGTLECLEELNIQYTGISHLPHNISSLKGLCVVGSVAVLQSCVLASEIQTSEAETTCYGQDVNTSNIRKQIFDFNRIRQLSTPAVASSSTSSVHKSFKYNVFLSFRGEDTSEAFVNHLYAAFQRQGTHTYMDDGRMEQGRKIDNELTRSIQDSKFFIIVFSKNYASSSWCLDELMKIMECHKTTEHTAYPVFYDVEPSDVREQIGAVGKAFAKHENEEAVEKWRQALKEATDLAGWDLKNTADGDEAKFIEKVVEEIWLEMHSLNVYINRKMIGTEPQIQEILSSLGPGVGDVQMIGITGMGGVGKKTLAKAIFDRVSFHFEGTSFVENVREVSKASLSGLKSLQKQVLLDVLTEERITVSSVSEGENMIKKELGDRKVLVVLDDVDHVEQLEALACSPNWFGKGSIIIITTRDEPLLRAHGVQQLHRVHALSEEEGICLFSWYAFWGDIPVQGYEQLSLEVVRCAACIPLAIKVLGSFLRGKNECEWKDVLRRLQVISVDRGGLNVISLEQTLEILEASYVSLEDEHKEIFLDVVCFMKGLLEIDATRILESCGFPARIGLRVLQNKSLLAISDDHRLGMDDYTEEMGMNIVRRSHPGQPNRHSRLWIQEEIEDILANDLGTEATRCMQLMELQLSPNIVMEGLGCMEELRCLIVEPETDNDDISSDWEFVEVRHYLPNALRFLRWVHYPIRSLPQTFQADNLVALEMPHSKIIKLWDGGEKKVLNKLRFLDLSYSKLTTLDLGLTPQLEWLELKECHDLVELHMAVGCLKRLVHLDLIGCSRFKSFPFIKGLESLEVLSLTKLRLKAKPLNEFPRYANDDLPKLLFTCLYSEEVPSSIRDYQKSVSINLQSRTKLESVSGSICGLQHLRHLTFSGCLPELPNDLDLLQGLEKLNLLSTHIKCLPDSLCMLKQLKSLKLKSCLLLEELPKDLGQLVCLEKLSLLSTRIRHLPDSICMLKRLKSLKLKSCSLLEKLPKDLGQLVCLEKLDLLSSRIRFLPDSICMLKHLKSLKLESCWLLEKLPQDLGRLECLEKLILTECASLRDIPISICEMNNLTCFHLAYCVRVKELPVELGRLKGLRELDVKGTGISHLPQSMSLLKDVCIVGSLAVLRSCDFAPEVLTSEGETFCYLQP